MTWGNRIRLVLGLVTVLAIVAGCTALFTRRQSEVTSTSATIAADQYVIGTDYGGTVVSQNVRRGETVTAGQVLFQVRSLALMQEIERNPVTFNTASYTVAKNGTMTFKATVSGTVSQVKVKQGDYVQPGSDLVKIDKAQSLFVTGDYTLSPRDYERVESGGAVDIVLPNQQVLPGSVQAVTVRTIDGQAQAQITVASSQLKEGAYAGLVSPGTPVTAKLHLREDDALAGARDAANDFLQKIGV
jgi:multidrug resistance efflux pump